MARSLTNMRGGIYIVLIVSLAGCGGGGTEPVVSQPISSVIGQFDLVEYDGAPLPAPTGPVIVTISAIPGDMRTLSCPVMMSAATIQIASDSSVTRTSHITYPCTGTLPRTGIPDSTIQVDVGTVRQTGDSLTFAYVAQSGRPSTEYGRLNGSDLVFYLARAGVGVTETVGSIHRVYRKK